MFFVKSDFQESGGTFSANLKVDGAGRTACRVYATSGMVAKTPYRIDFAYTTSDNGWLQPAALSASSAMPGLAGMPARPKTAVSVSQPAPRMASEAGRPCGFLSRVSACVLTMCGSTFS